VSRVLTGIVARHVMPVALDRLLDDPVLLLEGPRSVGKSTLLTTINAQLGGRLLDLDDPATRDAVAADPATFTAGPGPVCIDEYQKAPVVLDAIKAELNRDTSPGRFVLTGSARHDSLPAAAQTLTGRLSMLTVDPLSHGEITGVRETLLRDLLVDVPNLSAAHPTSTTTREQYIDIVVAGGFPMALARATAPARNRWIDNYVALTLERDIRELSNIRQGHLLGPLFRQIAAQTAQVLNIDKVARDAELERTAATRYLDLLDRVFLTYRLPAWGKNLRSRVTKAPKVHVLDSGVAARMLRLTPAKLAALDPTSMTELGHLLEAFVVGELRRQASWLDDVGPVGHWRTSDGDEVDLIVERDDGAIVAFEVKTAARVSGDDFKGLRKLREALGDQFLAGVAFYLGERSYTYEDRLHVLPVDRLWIA
jgi:predicted AAA+ superfamily ATPase